MSNQTDLAGQVIKNLIQAVIRGGYSLQNVPRLLRQVIEGNLWRSFAVNAQDKVQEYEHFEQFVTAKVPFGLETTVETLMALCWNQGQRDVADMVDALLTRPAGRPRKIDVQPGIAQAEIGNNVPNKPELTPRPEGNTRDKGIRRLRESPKRLREEGKVEEAEKIEQLYTEVIENKKTVHAAMKEAGYRKTDYIQVRGDDLPKAAKTLAKRLSKEELKALIELLKQYAE